MDDEMANLLVPDNSFILEKLRELEMTKAQYLEKMAAAYISEVKIPITECEMVMEQLPHPLYGYRIYFQTRKSQRANTI